MWTFDRFSSDDSEDRLEVLTTVDPAEEKTYDVPLSAIHDHGNGAIFVRPLLDNQVQQQQQQQQQQQRSGLHKDVHTLKYLNVFVFILVHEILCKNEKVWRMSKKSIWSFKYSIKA